MSTLLISEIFPPQTGGSGRWFWEVYRRLPRQEYCVAAGATAGDAEFDQGHDLNLRRMPLTLHEWGVARWGALRRYTGLALQLRRVAKEQRVTAIHAARCLPEGWLAWLLSRLTGARYVVYVHGEDIEAAAQSRELKWMVGRVFNGAELVIANSGNTARLLEAGWPQSHGKTRVLHPGVDTERFVPVPRDEAVRERLGWSNRRVVLTVGRLQKRKGHDQLIRAAAQIREQVPDFLYAIAGDGEERAALEALAEGEGLREHVQFLGEVADAQLIECYQQCDLFALPNRQVGRDIEGFGMVLLEAQACGKPVIAGASGGTAETMRVPETGRLVDCDGPDDLAGVVSELLLDGELRERMGLAGREWVVEKFDWQALVEQAKDVFEGSLRLSAVG